MRQNPINTTAGKSRKGPQWPTRPTTHKLTGSDIPTRNHMRVAGLKRSPSGWGTGVTPLKPFLEGAVKRTKRRTQTLYCTPVWSICSEFELYSGPPTDTTEAPRADPGCTWHNAALSSLPCIWFALQQPRQSWMQRTLISSGASFSVAGFLSLAQRVPAPSYSTPPTPKSPPPSHSPSLPPSLPPSHLLQLSNHPMTFKGAWHPFEVGEGALALVSCPNPTQANKMHAGLKPTKANSCPLDVK